MRTRILLFLWPMLFVALPSAADVIYTRLPIGEDGLVSDVGGEYNSWIGVEAADSFVLESSAVLTSVQWWGLYDWPHGFVYPPPETDSFTIRLYENIPVFNEQNQVGVPQILPFYEVSGISGNRVHDSVYGEHVYAFSADIPPIQLEGGVRYWIAIVNDTTTNDYEDAWYWALTVNNNRYDVPPEEFVDLGHASLRLLGLDIPILYGYPPVAFQLTGSPVVPEPASMTLLGLGLAGLAVRLRRKTIR